VSDVQDFPLFRDLSPQGFQELKKAMSFRELADGQVLFRQGDTAEYVYVVRTGAVRISATHDGAEGVFAQLGPGDLFGEMGAVRQLPRTATAVSVGPTRLILFQADRFIELMGEHPSVAGLVLRTMRGRFRMDEARAEARHQRKGGDVLALFSASGGAGTSTLAAGIAQGLSSAGKSVLLVDLDLMFGDQGERFGIVEGPTLSDRVLTSSSEPTPDVVQSTPAGVDLLRAPARASEAEFVDARVVSEMVAELRGRYEVLVVDTSRRVEDFTLDLLDTAERALYVLTGDPLTVGHAQRWRDLVRQVGLGTDHVHGLVNRSREGVDPEGLGAQLGFSHIDLLPDDAVGAAAIGSPAEGEAENALARELADLATRLVAPDAPMSVPAPANWGGGI
jgi:CRP-like cAMP-binding protein